MRLGRWIMLGVGLVVLLGALGAQADADVAVVPVLALFPDALTAHASDLSSSAISNASSIENSTADPACNADATYHGEHQRTLPATGTQHAKDVALLLIECTGSQQNYQVSLTNTFEYYDPTRVPPCTNNWCTISGTPSSCNNPAFMGVAPYYCPLSFDYPENSPYLNKIHRAHFKMTSPYAQDW